MCRWFAYSRLADDEKAMIISAGMEIELNPYLSGIWAVCTSRKMIKKGINALEIVLD